MSLEKAAFRDGYQCIVGIDEAGRGPLSGPVVVAAVILGKDWNSRRIPVDDSKRLSPEERERLFGLIRQHALAYKIVCVHARVIDQVNILQATLLGMTKAVAGLPFRADFALVDGKQFPPLPCSGLPVVRGDQKSCSIAAASILAKVARDRIMCGYAKLYPQWQFEQHKGYPTQLHRDLIKSYGTCPWHRLSFLKKARHLEKVKQQLNLFESLTD